jgi:peptidoglycan/LPS O-acetylase OafA/YrhL
VFSDRNTALTATVLCAVAALGLNLWMQAAMAGTVANNSPAYFHPLNQLPVFLIGMALFQWQRHAAAPRLWVVGIFGVASFVATALLWRSGWPLAFALVPSTAGLAFAALASVASRLPLRWSHGLPARLCLVGRLSFAIYVIHVLFAWHALRPMAIAGAWQGDAAYLAALAAVTLLSCIAAIGLARWIEQPGIALGRALIRALPSSVPVGTR